MSLNDTITALGTSIINLVNNKVAKYVPPTATDINLGVVKPDGETITIDGNGVISSNGGASRNIGEIVASTVPLTDAGLHLLDGALISGSGAYADFVSYVKNLYNNNPNANYFCKNTTIRSYNYENIGRLSCTDGILNGFSSTTNYANAEVSTNPTTSMEFVIRIKQSPLARGTIVYPYNNAGGFYLRSETGTMHCCLWGVSDWYSMNLPLSADTWTYYKLTWDGTTYKCYSSTNGTSWTEGTSITSSTPLDFKGYMHLGGCNWEAVPFETGSIDLNKSYLKCNGSYVWRGYTDTSYTGEQLWQKQVTDHGVCGKFVYDATANTVRLPKVMGIIEGTTDSTTLGDLVEAGLPDHNHTFTLGHDTASGQGWEKICSGSVVHTTTLASEYNPIYGNSDTVQPQTIKVLYYIVIATSTKTDIQVDIDEIATDLNGKADTDLSNVPNSKGILTESYKNGTSWYRVYSDGWCEQGGEFSNIINSWKHISLLKEYATTSYTILFGGFDPSGFTYPDTIYTYHTKTNSSFYVGLRVFSSGDVSSKRGANWYTCGYIR